MFLRKKKRKLSLSEARRENRTDVWPTVAGHSQARVQYEADDAFHARYERALEATEMAEHDNRMRRLRYFGLEQAARAVRDVPGDACEIGCFRGLSAYLVADVFRDIGKPLAFHICDSFEGLSEFKAADESPERPISDEDKRRRWDFAWPEEKVRDNLAEFDFVRTHKGWVPEPFRDIADQRFCFAHIDVDLYEPTRDSLDFLWPRLNRRGALVFDDYGSCLFPGARKAIDEFFSGRSDFFLYEQPAGQAVAVKLEL